MNAYTLKRGVAYSHNKDGSIDIRLLAPWDGIGRLESYPPAVRIAVRSQHFLFATVEESQKLWAARQMGRDVEAAVWDDLLCKRADDVMRDQRKRQQQSDRDDAIVYGDANQPKWLQKLAAAMATHKEKEQDNSDNGNNEPERDR